MKIFEVVKCDEEFLDRLVWKHPSEDFNTKSQLIVGPAQEAVFILNGEAVSFKPGKYTLDTGNIPFLRKIMEIPYDGVSVFHCQVYFVNMTVALDLNWGTPSQFDIMDPIFQVPIRVGASGSMGLRIDDSQKFVLKLAASNTQITIASLTNYFRGLVATRVKTYLSRAMNEVSYLMITQYLDDISMAMHQKIREDMLPYGILLDSFYMPNIMVPEADKENINEVQRTLLRQNKLGYNWQDEQIADIMKRYASNTGSQSNVGGMIAQTPIALAFGQMFSQNVTPMFGSMFSRPPKAFGSENTPWQASQPEPIFPGGGVSPLKPRQSSGTPGNVFGTTPGNTPPLNAFGNVSAHTMDSTPGNPTAPPSSRMEMMKKMKEEMEGLMEMVNAGFLTTEEYEQIRQEWAQKIKNS